MRIINAEVAEVKIAEVTGDTVFLCEHSAIFLIEGDCPKMSRQCPGLTPTAMLTPR